MDKDHSYRGGGGGGGGGTLDCLQIDLGFLTCETAKHLDPKIMVFL